MQPLIALVAAPLLLFLPGYLTLRGALLALRREPVAGSGGVSEVGASAPKGPDLMEGVGLSVAASLLLSSVAAFILVLLGIFSLWLLLTVVGIYTALVALATARRRPLRPLFPVPFFARGELWPVLGAVIVMGVGLVLYSRYSENILLIRDPATHVNTAVHIAKTGSSLIEDPLYYSLDEGLRAAFVYERPVDSAKNQTDGFQIEYRLRGFPVDTRLDQTTPQFFNLLPTWQAVGYKISGIEGALLVVPVFGALSVLLIFLVGRRLFGSVAGLAAAALLSVNLAHFWYARTPGSEVLFQAVFLAALLFWLLFSSSRHLLYGVFAGVGFGTLALIRIDSILVLGGIAALYLYLTAARRLRRGDLSFLLPLLAVAALGLIGALHSSRPYVSLLYRTTDRAAELLIGLAVVGAIAALVGLLPRFRLSSLLRWLEANHSTAVRLLLAAGLIGIAVFAYFGRPGIQESVSVNLEGIRTSRYAEESFVRLGWYVSSLGLALAVIGGAMAIFRSTSRGLTLFLLTSLLVTFYYLIDPRVAPDHFWAVRRYVPVTIPMSLLFIGLVVQRLGWKDMAPWSPSPATGKPLSRAYGFAVLFSFFSRALLLVQSIRLNRYLLALVALVALVEGKVVAVGLLGVLLGLSVHQIWGFVSYREQDGSIIQVEQVARQFPPDSVIVFKDSDLGDLLAPPLKLVHGLETFVMRPPGAADWRRTLCGPGHQYPSAQDPSSCVLARLAASSGERPFFWVAPTSHRPPQFVKDAFRKLEGPDVKIAVPRLEAPFTRLPRRSGVYPMVLTGTVYQLDR